MFTSFRKTTLTTSAAAFRYTLVLAALAVLASTAFAGVPLIPVPIITFLSPVSALPGGADITLTVNGANFVTAVSVVNWSGIPLVTTFVSANQLMAVVPAALTAVGGTGWVTVTNNACGTCIASAQLSSNVVYFPVVNTTTTYVAAELYAAVGNTPFTLSSGDFNKDGKLDLAVSNYSDGTLSILLGNGDGTFLQQQTYSSIGQPFAIAIGDLNGDGVPDLVVGSDNTGLNVFLGDANGDGGFIAGVFLSGGECLLEPVLADLNRDGNLDIVAGNCGSGLVVFLGNGDGTFAPAASVSSPGNAFNAVVADFNGDGILDVAASDHGDSTVDIYLGAGDGTFAAPSQTSVPRGPYGMAMGDFNSDGNIDLIVGSASGTGITLLEGDGLGGFPTQIAVATTDSYFSVATADMNGDGFLDIVASDINTGIVKVWLGDGTGAFTPPVSIGAANTAYTFALGNFATTGGLDIAINSLTSSHVAILIPTVVVSPSSDNFGNVAVGGSAQQIFTVTNDSPNTVTISGIAFTGANPTDFVDTNTCTAALATAATCTVTVTFSPAAVGARSAILTVTDNAAASPQTAALMGTGVAAPVVSLSPTSLAFGSETIDQTTTSQAVTLTNTGNAALAITLISVTGTNSADFAETNNCPESLSATSQCTINVTFTPSLIGAESASLQFTDNAADSPETVALGGTGVNVPPNYSITASPSTLTIAQGMAGTTTLTITPVGGITGTLSLACTGLPLKANCVFVPTQVTLTGNDEVATVTLTVNTTGSNGVLSQLRPSPFRWTSLRFYALLLFPAGFVLFVTPKRVKAAKKRNRYVYLALLLLLGALISVGMSSCGSSGSSPATPTGTYSVSAVATVGGSNSQSAVVSVTVTK
jgi:hypothetical protein